MNDDKIRWLETRYKSLIVKYMILLASIPIVGFTIVAIIEVVIFKQTIQLILVIGGIGTIILALLPLSLLKTAKKRVGYDSKNIYYIDREENKKKLRFKDIKKISAPTYEDSAIRVTTKNGGRVILGPGSGGKIGRSLIEEYKAWMNKNIKDDTSVKFEKYDIPLMKLGRYVIEYQNNEKSVPKEQKM